MARMLAPVRGEAAAHCSGVGTSADLSGSAGSCGCRSDEEPATMCRINEFGQHCRCTRAELEHPDTESARPGNVVNDERKGWMWIHHAARTD